MAQDLTSFGVTQVVVGLSQIVRFSPPAYMYGFAFKNVTASAGGTLEIVRPTFTGSSSMAGASGGWGTGYPLVQGEMFSAAGPVMFYLAATGITATVAVVMGNTTGATTL